MKITDIFIAPRISGTWQGIGLIGNQQHPEICDVNRLGKNIMAIPYRLRKYGPNNTVPLHEDSNDNNTILC